MTIFIIIVAVFIALMLLPFLVPMIAFRRSDDTSLYIKKNNARDPRYFSKSFREAFVANYTEGSRTVKLSREEQVLLPHELTGKTCDALVYAKAAFAPRTIKRFSKEIFAASSADISPKTQLRAIAAVGDIRLREDCDVIRWADSETMITADKGCNLGISTTSARMLLIDSGCTFRRLYAPKINIGKRVIKDHFGFIGLYIAQEWLKNPKEIKKSAIIRNTIVSDHDLIIGQGAIVYGHVKTTKRLTIQKGAVIMGNAIADDMLVLEEGVKVGGDVFSQESVCVGPNVQIGCSPKIKSLVAKQDIILCNSASIYGYVGCERIGRTVTYEEYQQLHRDYYGVSNEQV